MHFADFAIGHRAPFRIEQSHGNAGQRQADAAGTALASIGIADVHQRFGHTVALQRRVAEALAEFFEDLRGQRRASRRRRAA